MICTPRSRQRHGGEDLGSSPPRTYLGARGNGASPTATLTYNPALAPVGSYDLWSNLCFLYSARITVCSCCYIPRQCGVQSSFEIPSHSERTLRYDAANRSPADRAVWI
jgi:hypothetical protein